ncbi:MAG: hypothetical protein MSA77_09390 [Selenomonadales bacterium]|nr:hypothetical protein [Selenomonadales bacterium]
MDKDIKKYVDQRDINTLRYVFSQSLDVDPMFEEYSEEYEYCVSKGVFETHLEDGFTPLTNDKSKWDKSYWTKLCLDLEKNLSKKRLDHMREVAKVVYADKIKRLKEARAKQDADLKREKEDLARQRVQALEQVNKERSISNSVNDNSNNDKIQTKSSIEESNAKIKAARAKQDADIKRQTEELARQREQDLEQENKEGSSISNSASNGCTKPKKALGDSVHGKKVKHGLNWIAVIGAIIAIATIAYLIKR